MMSPQVTAAIIAAGVSVLTLLGTLATQYYDIRRTSSDSLNARFATAADQLGRTHRRSGWPGCPPMEGLADDWKEDWQTCVNALCGYLRLPYRPHRGAQASQDEQSAYRAWP